MADGEIRAQFLGLFVGPRSRRLAANLPDRVLVTV